MTDPELTTKYREAVTLGGGHVERTVRLLQCITHPEELQLRAQVTAVRALAVDMRTWCSPHGLADHYADSIELALDGQLDERQQITALVQLIRDAKHRLAALDPERCPADCAEGHTYRAPCSMAHPTVGELDTPAVITLPPKPTPPGPIIVQPCATDPLTAADQRQDAPPLSFSDVHAALDSIRAQASPATETEAIRAALAGRWVVVSYPVCEQIAAHPDTIAELKDDLDRVERLHPELWLLGLAPLGPFLGLPLVPDDSLPPGEVRLRPSSRPADGPS